MAQGTQAVGSVDFGGGGFVLRFPYEPRVLAEVKTLPGRRFDPVKKLWRVPGRASAVHPLVRLAGAEGWTLSAAAERAVKRIVDAEADEKDDGGGGRAAGGARGGIGNPRRQAGEWLRRYVAAYREVGRPVDVLEALKGLDRVVGYTPFGIHRSGDIGFAGEPGVTPLRASSLSHQLSKGARRTRRVRRIAD